MDAGPHGAPPVSGEARSPGRATPSGCPVGGHDTRLTPGRRAVLAAALGGLGAGGLAACSSGGGEDDARATEDLATGAPRQPRRVPFTGPHQPALTATPVPPLAAMAAFRVTAPDRAGLEEMFAELSTTVADLMAGRMPASRERAYPPPETGILGPDPVADDLGIVVSVGASLFDDRYGLAHRRPRELEKMPFLANDRLDPDRSHGDLLISVEAGHEDTILHAVRQVMRATRRHLVLRWMTDGYARTSSGNAASAPRNLLGFKDGTANLDSTDAELMERFVFVGPEDGEPEWAVGGSYHVVRVIRMFVEFWDRTRLVEQEEIFGRAKESGAPLGMDEESDVPDYSADPEGEVIPLDAHIRLANPRTPSTADDLMLRRGFSYTRGVDDVGQLDQGLAFVSYQRSLAQFLRVQERLNGEPLEEYILPEGGGFFFALPGVVEEGTSLGAALLS